MQLSIKIVKDGGKTIMNNKRYVLIVKYECGQCAFLTNNMDLDVALSEFREVQKQRCKDSLMFKDFNLPVITSAEILLLYK